MKKILAVAVALASASVVAPAAAQTDLSPFGTQGQLAISAQGGVRLFDAEGADTQVGLTPFLGWEFRKSTQPDLNNNGRYNSFKNSAFYINPGADYFVIDHLSIGGEVLFASTGFSTTRHAPGAGDTTDTISGTHWGIMPRVGYDIPLSSLFSFWPRGGIGFQTSSFSGGGGADTSNTLWYFFIDAPFLVHPIEHFFIGAGPGVTVSLSHTVKNGNVSVDGNSYLDFRLLTAVIGGYL